MKSKIITVLLGLLTVVAIGYAYMQRQDAEFQRNKANEMHREVVRLRNESEAARAEASKLRSVLELEKKRAEEALQELQSKTAKKK